MLPDVDLPDGAVWVWHPWMCWVPDKAFKLLSQELLDMYDELETTEVDYVITWAFKLGPNYCVNASEF